MALFSWTRWLRSLRPQKVKTLRKRDTSLRLEALENRLAPATFIWSGMGLTNKWSNGANWFGGIAPTGSAATLDSIVFQAGSGNTTNVNDLAGATFGSITFSGSGYSISGNAIALGSATVQGSGGITVASNVINDVVGLNIQLLAPAGTQQNINVNSAGILTLAGQLTGGVGLSKGGSGTLILGNDNSAFTGAITVAQGILQITNASALGSVDTTTTSFTHGTTVLTNATLQVAIPTTATNQTVRENIKLNGPGLGNQGALVASAGNSTWAGAVELDNDVFFGASAGADLTITGQITDLGAGHNVTKEGAGTIGFAAANSYRGTTTVNNGILQIQNARALGSADGTPATGTVVNSTITKSGTLQLFDSTGVGFTVLNELLTINGGGFNGQGALDNLQGNNTWTGNVTLGSFNAFSQSATIRTDGPGPGFTLTVSGVVQDPNQADTLVKTGLGTLILTNSNTYDTPTDIQQGILEITDSQGLGPQTKTALATVENGATLALGVDNLVDSVTGTFNTLSVNTPLDIQGIGAGGVGALYNLSGINTYTGPISLNGTVTNAETQTGGSIGVAADPNPTANSGYFTNDYSLTITGPLTGGDNDSTQTGFPSTSLLEKVGAGQLILPTANPQFVGAVEIRQGWITMGDSDALGTAVPTAAPNDQPTITVDAGGALHLNDTSGNGLVIHQNLVLAGQGFTHPDAQISLQGALENVGGNNVVRGNVFLQGQSGIGVERVLGNSQLTMTGQMTDTPPNPFLSVYVPVSQTFPFLRNDQNLIQVGSTSGTVTVNYNMGRDTVKLDVFYGDPNRGGTQIATTNNVTGVGSLTVPFGRSGGPSFSQIYIRTTFITWPQNLFGPDDYKYSAQINTDRTAGNGGFTKHGSGLLSLQGDGNYQGNVDIAQGVLLAQNNSALGAGTGTTTVESGAALVLASGPAYHNGALQTGVGVWNEHLVVNGSTEVQTVKVTGTAGSFTLSFNGRTTAPLAFNATAAQVQAALNGLSSISGVGGSVTVSLSGGVYTITFGGVLGTYNQPQITALSTGGATVTTSTVTDGVGNTSLGVSIAPLTVWSDSTLYASSTYLHSIGADSIVPSDNTWRGPITLNAATPIDIGAGSRLILDGAVDDATNLSNAGSDLIKLDTGELVMADASTYRGATYVGTGSVVPTAGSHPFAAVDLFFTGSTTQAMPGGTLSVSNGQGLGAPNGNVVVQTGSALQLIGNVVVPGKTLTLGGQGTSSAPSTLPQGWFEQGPAPVTGAQTPGSQNVSGRMTGIAVDPNDPNTIYVSTAGGGAWKTVNGGKSWTQLFDNINAMFSGAIAVAPSNPNIIYLGTGEASNSGDSFYGSGVYMSTDAGRSWTLLTSSFGTPNPLNGTAISKIVVDPNNANRIWVAASDLAVNGGAGSGNAGIWRYDGTNWLNLTGIVSDTRSNPPAGGGFPNPVTTPGPDDDFRLSFPNTFTDYSDLIYVPFPGTMAGEPTIEHGVLYMSLGSPGFGPQFSPVQPGFWGTQFTYLDPTDPAVNNAVYRLMNPITANATNSKPTWYVGAGNPGGTYGAGGGEYPTDVGNIGSTASPPPPVVRNGMIKITATYTLGDNPSPFNDIPPFNGVPPANPPLTYLDFITLYAVNPQPIDFDNPGVGSPLFDIQKSTDGGKTWGAVTTAPPNFLAAQGWYDNTIVTKPGGNGNTVYVGGADTGSGNNFILMSPDGGATWTDITVDSAGKGPHTDEHASAIDNNGILYMGGDGGIFRLETNAGNLWTDINSNLATITFNGIAVDPSNPDRYLGGSQDNGVEMFNAGQAWQWVDFGDGGLVRIDQNDPTQAYRVINGFLSKSTSGGAIGTWNPILQATFDGALYFPFLLDSLTPGRVLVGGDKVVGPFVIPAVRESFDGGATWIDLNSNNIPDFGSDITSLAAATYQGTFALDPGFSHVGDKGANTYDQDTIYASDGFGIYLTKDHGQHWINRTGTIPGSGIANIAVDPRNRDVVYVVRSTNDGAGQIFKSTDAGQTWTDITGTWVDGNGNTIAAPNIPVWTAVVDPRTGMVYIGTDKGIYASLDGAPSWHAFGQGMPQVQVKDLDLQQGSNTLTAGTYGRSAFQILLNGTQANAGGLNVVSGQAVWTGNIVLAGDTFIGAEGTQQIHNGIATASLNILGSISDLPGTTNNKLTKIGLGNVILSGANTYSGLTEVAQGNLIANNPQALGGTVNGTVVDPGAALQVESSVNGEPLLLNNDGPTAGFNGHNTGSLESISGDNTYSGLITLNTDVTIGVDSGSTLTITNTITGAHNIVKELTGTLALADDNSPAAHGYTGATYVYQGALAIENSKALASSTGTTVLDGAQLQLLAVGGVNVAVTGESLDLSGTGINGTGALLNVSGNNSWAGSITLDANPGFAPNTLSPGAVSINVAGATDTLTLSGVVGEAGGIPSGLAKIGPGELVLSGANTYTGGTYVKEGLVTVTNAHGLGAGSLDGKEVQRITVDGTGGTYLLTFRGATTGPIAFNAGATTVANALNALSTIGGAGGSVTVTRAIVNGPLTAGTPTPNFTQFIYTVTFNNLPGDLPVMTADGSGGADVVVTAVSEGGAGTVVSDGAALHLDLDPTNTGTPVTVTGESVRLNGSGLNDDGSGALRTVSGIITWTGGVDLATSSTVFTTAGTSLTVNGPVTGPSAAALTKDGTGTLAFSSANTFQGTTFVQNGILGIGNSRGLGGGLTDDQQQLTVSGPSTGSFRLSFSGGGITQSTPGLPATATAAQVQAALAALPNIGPGNVAVTQNGTVFTVTFIGALAGRDQPQLTATTSASTRVDIVTLNNGGLGDTFVSAGATLQLFGGAHVSTERLTLSGTGFGGIGALDSLSGNNSWDPDTTPVNPDPVPPDSTIIMTGDTTIGSHGTSVLTIDQRIVETQGGTNVTKVGSGTLKFSGTTNNGYSGLTTVKDGKLELAKTGSAIDIPANLVIGDGVGALLSASVQLDTNGQVPSTSTVTINGDGLFNLNGHSQTLAALNMTGGTVNIAGAVTTLTMNGPVTASSDAAGNPAVIGGTGSLLENGTARTFNVTSGATATHPADLDVQTAIVGPGLVKTGNGRLELDADLTGTLTAPIQATGGDVQVDNAITEIDLNGGGVSGHGTVGMIGGPLGPGSLVVGSIAPGDNGTPGHQISFLTNNPGADVELWGPGTTFSVDLHNAVDQFGNDAAGTGYDQLIVNGNLDLGGATLTGTSVAGIGLGDQFTIITVPVGDRITGTFAEPGAPQTVFIGGAKFHVDYNQTSVVLTRVRESVTISLASSQNPSVFGQDIVYTATVTPEAGAGTLPPGYSVSFTLDGNTAGSVSVPINANDQAILDLQAAIPASFPLSVGGHTMDALFVGDAAIDPVAAQTVNQVVNKANTTTTLTYSPNQTGRPVFGEPITVTAHVRPVSPGGGLPTPGESVNFIVDGNVASPRVGTINASGDASIILTGLSVGPHTVSASYAGDASYNPSGTGIATTINVSKDSTTLTVSPNQASQVFGTPVTFTATLSVAAPGTGAPTTGEVISFFEGNTLLATRALSGPDAQGNYDATFTTSTFGFGTHTIRVTYAGDAHLNAASGQTTYTVTQVGTTTTLSSSVSPSTFGQPVTFTAHVTSASGPIPTGPVTFMEGSTPLGTANLNASGNAVFTTTALTLGTHNITASYAGDANDQGSSSNTVSQVVQYGSVTTVTSSLNPSTAGQSVTFTATVRPATGTPTGAPTPDGSVQFSVDGVAVGGPVSLNPSGVATFTTSTLAAGVHTITAAYSSVNGYNSSTGTVSQTVRANSSTTLTSSLNPSGFGNSVTFTATVTGPGPVPTGTVTFRIDTGVAVVSLNASGVATFTTNLLGRGQHAVSATYNGNTVYVGSTASLTQTVLYTSTAALASTVNPATFGAPVLFMVIIRGGPGTPTNVVPVGSVTFFVDNSPATTVPLNGSGIATYTTSTLGVGAHTVSVSYAGNSNFTGSSAMMTETVRSASTTVLSSSNPSSVYSEYVTFTANVTATSPGALAPAGTVTFKDGSTVLATQTVSPTGATTAQATFTTRLLSVASHSITASFAPASGNPVSPSTSNTVTQVVRKDDTTTSLTSSANPSRWQQAVTFTATVTPNGAGTLPPGGSVTFFVDGAARGTVTLNSSGVATLTTANLALGNRVVTASYSGSSTFNPSGGTLTGGQQVNAADTSTTLTSSANPSVIGQTVTVAATVRAASPGGGTPAGTVTFSVDSVAVGVPVTLNASGVASIQLSGLSFGSHTISTTFTPSTANYNPSMQSFTQNVLNASHTTVASSLNPSREHQSVRFTATVTGVAGTTPTGTLTFYDGGTAIGTGTLNASGQATFTTSALLGGTHTITAIYGGDANYVGSSGSMAQVVNFVPVSMTAAVTSPASGIVTPNTAFTVTASVFDRNGNLVTSYGSPYTATISLVSSTTGGTLSGGGTVVFSGGKAIFSGLMVNRTGTYTLQVVTSEGLVATLTFSTGRIT
jgi:autotransporter-associated beta strand protein